VRSAALLWVVLAAGCGGCPTPAGPVSPPPGVHLPLPEGWTAVLQPDHGLRAGPKGHTVLRVEVRPADPTQPLPTPLELAEGFSRDGSSLRVTTVSEVTEKDVSLVLLEVSKQGSRARVMLGVKRLGHELFLCSSEPGSGEEEVREAQEACKGLSVGGDA
jgi:hypothetical protein